MSFWIFKSNPDHDRIDARLRDPDPNMVWAVTRYHDRIQKGDTVFIWRTGTPRGICAIMVIELCPYEPEPHEINTAYGLPAENSAAGNSNLWAKGRLIQRFSTIETSVIKKIDGLELFSFFSAFQQATTFSITRPEGARLLEFIEKNQTELPAKTLEKPSIKTKKPVPARTTGNQKTRPISSANKPAESALLKCGVCGRYVVSSDTDRHIRENHDGQPVEWKKTK